MHSAHLLFSAAVLALAATAPAQNQAISLASGASGYFDVQPLAPFNPPTGITVEAWITYDDSTVPTGAGNYWPTVCRANVAPGGEAYFLRVGASSTNNLNLEWAVKTQFGGLQFCVYQFTPGEFQSWTHIAATYDGINLRLFKNGAQVAALPFTTEIFQVTNPSAVFRVGDGDISFPGFETWNGMIDELRVWPFARTGGEITSTMNMELQAMPGRVVTFNLNGSYLDSSQGLLGMPTPSNIAFTSNAPVLAVNLGGGANLGASTTTCSRTIDIGMTAPAFVGNQDFAVVATKASPNALFGALVISGAQLPGPVPFFGVNVHVDLNQVLATALMIPGSDRLGNARVDLPIPANPVLGGTSFFTQYGFADATCGPQGFTGSDGLAFGIQ